MKANILEKVLITFVEGFLSSLVVTVPVMQDYEKGAILSIFITAICCGMSAVINYILNIIREQNEVISNIDKTKEFNTMIANTNIESEGIKYEYEQK